MYCGHCGKEVQDGAEFCPKCGKEVTRQPDRRRERGAYYRECTRKRRWRHVRHFITFLVILLALVVALQLGYRWWQNQQAEETTAAVGRDSYTTLVTDYLQAAQNGDLETISSLFFPGSESFYQNSEGDRPLSMILPQEDKWAANYSKPVSTVALDKAQFVSLTGEKASDVVRTIETYGSVTGINELYSVQGIVTYGDGSQVNMVFEVVQCDQGCFLVNIDGAAE